jgi:hypothetical protein
MTAFQKSHDAAAINKIWKIREFKKPNRGRISEATPVDRSQIKMIPLICSVEKILVIEGSPAFS